MVDVNKLQENAKRVKTNEMGPSICFGTSTGFGSETYSAYFIWVVRTCQITTLPYGMKGKDMGRRGACTRSTCFKVEGLQVI